MRRFKAALRIAAVSAVLATGLVAVTQSPALAAGCVTGFVSPNGYHAGACWDYPSYFKVQAKVYCNNLVFTGPWAVVGAFSTVQCPTGWLRTNPSYMVSP
jgi:hypothetical protein